MFGPLQTLFENYKKATPSLQKVIDVYLVYVLLTGVIQFVYVVAVGTYPFNSFLSGFISTVGCFVLAVSLRQQINQKNQLDFPTRPRRERAFADFLFCNIILLLTATTFMG